MRRVLISNLLAFITISMAACGAAPLPDVSAEQSSGKHVVVGEALASGETVGGEEAVSGEETVADGEAAGAEESAAEKYAVGDIILADGSVIKEEDLNDLADSNAPTAVIAGFRDDGGAFGVGVHRSDTPLPWAVDDSAGYSTGFADIVCTQGPGSVFNGDKDGSDNWEIICAQDGPGAADASENYPAFYFVSTYAQTYGLAGDYASGWYMPSIPELCEIYRNREAVNASLQKIYKMDNEAAMNGLETNWYWSSSQAGAEDDYAWFVHFFNGYAGECPKNFTNVHVLAVRAF